MTGFIPRSLGLLLSSNTEILQGTGMEPLLLKIVGSWWMVMGSWRLAEVAAAGIVLTESAPRVPYMGK
jgi:hypothetical protein